VCRNHLVAVTNRGQVDTAVPARELLEQQRKLCCRVPGQVLSELADGLLD
jgi:hypothetical protein